jgi:hypothetical protein
MKLNDIEYTFDISLDFEDQDVIRCYVRFGTLLEFATEDDLIHLEHAIGEIDLSSTHLVFPTILKDKSYRVLTKSEYDLLSFEQIKKFVLRSQDINSLFEKVPYKKV